MSKKRSDMAKLALGALGVVYGDIGTSPLYALKECVTAPHGVAPLPANIYGLLSLFFWSITLVDTSFYLGRETLILKPGGKGMADWRKYLFRFLSRNARSATDFFAIPPNRVVEIGAQIEI
jgi:K+ transporter